MAPFMSGFPLENVHWNRFKGSYMWNNIYHLRRTKFIVYQLATLFTCVCNSIGVALLTDYNDSQAGVQEADPSIYVYNNDLIGAMAFNVWACVFVAVVFTPAFILDLIWPERIESARARLTWKIGSVLSCIFMIASAITLTVIVATHCGYITGDIVRGQQLLDLYVKDNGTPLCYRRNARSVVVVIFAWLSFVVVFASTIVLFLSIRHDERGLGPWSKAGLARKESAIATDGKMEDSSMGNDLTEKEVRNSAAPSAYHTDHAPSTAPVAESHVPAHTAPQQ